MKRFQLKRNSMVIKRLFGQYILNPRTRVRARHFYRYASSIGLISRRGYLRATTHLRRPLYGQPIVILNSNAYARAQIRKQIREALNGSFNSSDSAWMQHMKGNKRKWIHKFQPPDSIDYAITKEITDEQDLLSNSPRLRNSARMKKRAVERNFWFQSSRVREGVRTKKRDVEQNFWFQSQRSYERETAPIAP